MLQPDEDAFGHHLLDHLEGREGTALLERDDGFIQPALQAPAFFTSFDDWWRSEKEAIAHATGRVLDVGCGAGRHALYLQELGHEVLAIDVSPLAVEVARRRGVGRAEVLALPTLSCISSCRLADTSSDLGVFDTVLMFCGGFGLFGSVDDARDSLRRLHTMTSEDARIVVESVDPHLTKEPEHLEYMSHNVEAGRSPGQMRLRFRYRRYATPWSDWLNASRDEVAGVVADAGWRIAERIDENEAEFVVILTKN